MLALEGDREIMPPANSVRCHGPAAQLADMQRMRAHFCPEAVAEKISKCCFWKGCAISAIGCVT